MDSNMTDSCVFLAKGNRAQFAFVFDLYPQALGLKSQSKNKKPEELKKLDQWYHDELPKKFQSRAKEGGYLLHEELVQTIKWKLARGKWRPRLKELVTMNTPRLVQLETKKAFRQLLKKEDLNSAIQAMCNLKGVGPAMASAVLSIAQPDKIPFMSDECMKALPDSEGSIDYTNKEYMRLVSHVRSACQRLSMNGVSEWTPRKIEQVIFAHHVIANNKPELLEGMPGFTTNGEANGDNTENGAGDAVKDAEAETKANGDPGLEAGGSGENSRDGAASASAAELDENTNDSIPSTEGSSGAIAPSEDANMGGEESNESSKVVSSSNSHADDDSSSADNDVTSAGGGGDSTSMPPPAAPEAADTTATTTAAATATDGAGEPADSSSDAAVAASAKREADQDCQQASDAKRARPDPGPAE